MGKAGGEVGGGEAQCGAGTEAGVMDPTVTGGGAALMWGRNIVPWPCPKCTLQANFTFLMRIQGPRSRGRESRCGKARHRPAHTPVSIAKLSFWLIHQSGAKLL